MDKPEKKTMGRPPTSTEDDRSAIRSELGKGKTPPDIANDLQVPLWLVYEVRRNLNSEGKEAA